MPRKLPRPCPRSGAALLALVLLAAPPCLPAAAAAAEFLVGGTQVHEEDHGGWARALSASGLNTVAVTVYGRQGEWDGGELDYPPDDPAVVEEIRAARAQGLHVVLVLRVALDHAHERNRFLWHGMIMPASAEQIAGWFERYTAFVTHWARIAEREGVEVLGIGSELNALNETLPITRRVNLENYYRFYWYQRLVRSRARRHAERIEPHHLWVRGFDNYGSLDAFLDARFEQNVGWASQAYLRPGGHTLRRINERRTLINTAWLELIARTRGVYSGHLTYAANFDSYRSVGFWGALDMIGINAYFSLLPTVIEDLDGESKLARFEASWRRVLDGISDLRRDQGLQHLPVLFTEIGYTYRRHSTVEPWAHDGFSVVGWKGSRRRLVIWGEQPVDYEERRMALEALRRAHHERPDELHGLLYWKLSTQAEHERIEPFVLHIGADSRDPSLAVLAAFGSPNPADGRP